MRKVFDDIRSILLIATILFIVFLPLMLISGKLMANNNKQGEDLVNILDINPSIKVELLYATPHNLVGKKIYSQETCYVRYAVGLKLERTKEIGIKLALGATRSVILKQFLIESVVLCLCGGVIGVLLGVGVSMILGKFTHLPAILEWLPVMLALIITSLIGICFGYYPAQKASNLNPVESLSEK